MVGLADRLDMTIAVDWNLLNHKTAHLCNDSQGDKPNKSNVTFFEELLTVAYCFG